MEESNNTPPLSLDILSALDEVQGHHGVPIGDYSDYAAYCTRKLRRLREKAPQLLSHAGKYAKKDTAAAASTSTTAGSSKSRRYAFVPRSFDDISPEDPVILWYFLFQAERAWARALLQTSRGKMKTAAAWAFRLEQACGVSCTDASTMAQCTGYAAWMRGNAYLERREHAGALQEYQATVTAWTESSPERVETTVRPLVRYCQYEVGGNIYATEENAKEAPPKILLEFRGESVALDKHQQLAVAYLKMEEALELDDPSSLDETAIESLISDLDDALAVVPAELSLVSDYFVFSKRKYWQLLQEGREESVTLYRALQANAQAMVDLIEDEDDDDRLLAAAHVLRFRAAACVQLSATLSSVQEQLVLLQHAAELLDSATEEFSACQVEDTDFLQVLGEQLATAQCRAEASAVLTQASGPAAAPTGPLWLHLQNPRYDATALVEATPSYMPILAKGVMFDLAWPYIAANTEGLQDQPKSSWSWFSK